MAHPIVSFQFADSPPLCFSIETRKKVGQSYSAIGGLYRQYSIQNPRLGGLSQARNPISCDSSPTQVVA
jgi:hypothetical protein